ncbi:MAG: PorT family protein [Prevotella sp.]|nr:PorT family protein [Prevotella sp.]MBR1934284.1 PorT family protein [Prevotella sp.]
MVCCLWYTPARAQIGEHRSELAIGAGGGYVMTTIGFMPEVPQLQHPGVMGGLAVRYTSEKYFSSICAIVAELNYAQLGWKEDILTPQDEPVINKVTGLPEEYERDLTYLQIPVFARLGWGRERKGFQAFFQAGPQMGIYLNEKTKTNFNFDDRTPVYTDGTGRTSSVVAQDTMAVERKFDYGIAAGLGLEYSHPRLGHFLLEGRYYYGLGDIYGNSKRDYFGRSNFGTIYVKLTYLFDLAKTNNPKIK